MVQKLGIIAGGGLLPLEIAKIYKNSGGECFVASIRREVNPLLSSSFPCESFPIGSVGSVLSYFKKYGVREIVFAGKIERPNLKDLKVDSVGALLLAKISAKKFLGDDSALSVISSFLEARGYKIIAPADILSGGSSGSVLAETKAKPSKAELRDIELGRKVIGSLSDCDVGQAVIAADGYVLGIEAAEGTDALIKRCALLRKGKTGGILVKAAKKGQDLRMDPPSIGPDTLILLSALGFRGLAFDFKNGLVISPEESLKIADEKNLFVSAI